MTLVNILLKGIIRVGISYSASCALSIYTNAKYGDIFPEYSYGYYKKDKKKYIKTIVTYAFYFVPVLGTILLVGDLLVVGGSIIINQIYGNRRDLTKKITDKIEKNIEMPDRRLERLQRGQSMYKSIIDAAKLDGLDDTEIENFVKEASAEEPYLGDNSKEININDQRVKNLILLSSVKDSLKKPKKLYQYCLNKKIEYVDVENNDMIVGVTKPNKNGEFEDLDNKTNLKIYTKKFKLQ